MAGNEPGFEESTRALYAGDADRFETLTESWPVDVATTRELAADAFTPERREGMASDRKAAARAYRRSDARWVCSRCEHETG